MTRIAHWQARSLRFLVVLLALSAFVTVFPAGLFMMMLVGSGNAPLMIIWAVGAFCLAIFNILGGIVLLHRPRPRIVEGMAAAPLVVLLTCPVLWIMAGLGG